eukprot:scaffold221474_cov17-Tisochrysis_lutea.AAC.1
MILPCKAAPQECTPVQRSHLLFHVIAYLAAEAFQERVKEFKEWLLQRPETCIAIVAHWGLIYELTGGVDFANCVSSLKRRDLWPGWTEQNSFMKACWHVFMLPSLCARESAVYEHPILSEADDSDNNAPVLHWYTRHQIPMYRRTGRKFILQSHAQTRDYLKAFCKQLASFAAQDSGMLHASAAVRLW